MKKTIILLLAIAVCATSATPVFATNQNITNSEPIEFVCDEGAASISDCGEYIILKASKEVQPENSICENGIHQGINSENNDIQGQVLMTVFIPESEEGHDAILKGLSDAIYGSGSSILFRDAIAIGSDSCMCATFTVDVYYSKQSMDDGFDYYDIISVTGGYSSTTGTGTYVGENVYVTGQSLNVSQVGDTYGSGPFHNEQVDWDYYISPSSRTWTYTPPTSWYAVADCGTGAKVLANYSFTLTRGSSSWTTPLKASAIDT